MKFHSKQKIPCEVISLAGVKYLKGGEKMQDATLRRLIKCLKEKGYADSEIIAILIYITKKSDTE